MGKSLTNDTILIIMATQNSQWPVRPFNRQQLWVLDPYTGAKKREITAFDSVEVNNYRQFCISDIELDGVPEVVFITDSIICQDTDGAFKYSNYVGLGAESDGVSTLSINSADFNQDGLAEFYSGSFIFNSLNGKVLLRGRNGVGSNDDVNRYKYLNHTLAADVLPHLGLELLAGNTVYTVEINNLNGMSGNVITPYFPK